MKYALILALTMGLLLLSYHYWVRGTFVGKFLNGRKYSRGAMAIAGTASTAPG